MSPEKILLAASIQGLRVELNAEGKPVVRGGAPSPDLLAVLKSHRDEIVRHLGGELVACDKLPQPDPDPVQECEYEPEQEQEPVEDPGGWQKCPGHFVPVKGRDGLWWDCGAWVKEPEDSEAFCQQSRRCPMRQAARRANEPW